MKDEISFSTSECVLGTVLIATSARGVCAILLGDDAGRLASELRRQFPQATLRESRAQHAPLLSDVAKLVASPGRRVHFPLDMQGTAFQLRVWNALREIPAGATQSYAQVAQRVGASASAKEVGEACAANALAVAIPCHRVVRKDGSLAGYRWGVARKRALLRLERAAA
jgi:AraC family transcriptional regulator, regulatory protein of adaptative response / methylated-DNA-[protein]-cysteine methyltransferase